MQTIVNKYLRKLIWPAVGILLGAIGGYMYWYFIGCTGEVCPIYSVWWRSTLYGAVMGGLVFSLLEDGLKFLKNAKW